MKLCLWAALITLFWLQSHLGQCLDAFLHALSGLWTCKQWKSKNVWIWPRESLQGRGCTPPPPPHPPPRLHYAKKVSETDWRTEGKWGNREWCSNAANHFKNFSTVDSEFGDDFTVFPTFVSTDTLKHLNSLWTALHDSYRSLMMYTYLIPLVPFLIILIYKAAI